MKKRHAIAQCILQVFCLVLWCSVSLAQGALEGLESAAKISISDVKVPEVGESVCIDCPSSKEEKVQIGKSVQSKPDYNTIIAGTIFKSMLTSMFSTGSSADLAQQYEALKAQQAAAQAQAQHAMALEQQKEAAFKAQHNRMMEAYKQPGGSSGTAYKSLTDAASGSRGAYKTLDDSESLASSARMPFDTPSGQTADSDGLTIGNATPFFGDTMPPEDINLLVNPENDPRVVDLREAETYIVENLKEVDDANRDTITSKLEGKGAPIIEKPDCEKLSKKLKGYVDQRNKFQKTVMLARSQVDTWQEANRNAMLNVALDGINYFTGQFLEGVSHRGRVVARYERMYKTNAGSMAKDGINTKEIEAKINKLKMFPSAGEIAEMISNVKDWNEFLKHGMSGLILQLADSNQDIERMLEDPKMQKYFDFDTPELKALLDISKIAASNKVFGKWVVKKMPVVAGIELAVNQAYNATDWLLSFNRIMDANNINGKVLDTAKQIQKNIDDTYMAMEECHVQ